MSFCVFFFNDTATTEIYTLSLHDALPILQESGEGPPRFPQVDVAPARLGAALAQLAEAERADQRDDPAHDPRGEDERSEEHTSELQSPCNLVCRLLLEKKKK